LEYGYNLLLHLVLRDGGDEVLLNASEKMIVRLLNLRLPGREQRTSTSEPIYLHGRSRRASHHGRLVLGELGKELSQLRLHLLICKAKTGKRGSISKSHQRVVRACEACTCKPRVRLGKETATRGTGGEPVSGGQTLDEGHEVLYEISLGQHVGNLAQRLHRLLSL
jgi:hypothetical protein